MKTFKLFQLLLALNILLLPAFSISKCCMSDKSKQACHKQQIKCCSSQEKSDHKECKCFNKQNPLPKAVESIKTNLTNNDISKNQFLVRTFSLIFPSINYYFNNIEYTRHFLSPFSIGSKYPLLC